MIIGFGFGNPLVSLLMLLGTSVLSYLLYRAFSHRSHRDSRPTHDELRQYYYEQRRRARELTEQYDVSDEEIEKRINDQLEPTSIE